MCMCMSPEWNQQTVSKGNKKLPKDGEISRGAVTPHASQALPSYQNARIRHYGAVNLSQSLI